VQLPADIHADLQRAAWPGESSGAVLLGRRVSLPVGKCSRSAAVEIRALASLPPRYVTRRRLRALRQLLAVNGQYPQRLNL
jgi:hypothetical protein